MKGLSGDAATFGPGLLLPEFLKQFQFGLAQLPRGQQVGPAQPGAAEGLLQPSVLRSEPGDLLAEIRRERH